MMQIHMRVTAYHMMQSLGTGLYSDYGQSLWELVRNSLVASMPSIDHWEPKLARVEIFLAPNHPLCNNRRGESALIVLDHGCGLTDPALDRYFSWLGTPVSELGNSNRGNGASQKGIGRLAALALNAKCSDDDAMTRVTNGYHILSRTSKAGDVRFVSFIPKVVEDEGFNLNRFISPDSTEMGPIKNITGSFTAIVIPTPVFKTHEEIIEAIKWYLPREHDKMFDLRIGGKQVTPPPLQDELNITSPDGKFRARLGVGNADSDGVWLCDAETALRVANCQKIGSRRLPQPLWLPDCIGDIFAPGLLKHQDTARTTLSQEYFRSRVWQRLSMFLNRDVAPAAKKLMERDIIRGGAADTLDELVDMFKDTFGEAEVIDGVDIFRGPRKKNEPKGPVTPKKPTDGDGGNGDTGKDRYRRLVTIKVLGETYTLLRGQSLPPFQFAKCNPNNLRMISVNVRGGYQALPKGKSERREHCLMQLLLEIGRSKNQTDLHAAVCFANSVRAEFMKK